MPGQDVPVASWDDVARVCRALPGAAEVASPSGRRRWAVRGRTFLRERPLHRKDLDELGESAPDGPVMVAYVPDEGAKRALLAEEPEVFFSTSHFAGVPALMVRLDRLDDTALTEIAGEAWAARAPRSLVEGNPV